MCCGSASTTDPHALRATTDQGGPDDEDGSSASVDAEELQDSECSDVEEEDLPDSELEEEDPPEWHDVALLCYGLGATMSDVWLTASCQHLLLLSTLTTMKTLFTLQGHCIFQLLAAPDLEGCALVECPQYICVLHELTSTCLVDSSVVAPPPPPPIDFQPDQDVVELSSLHAAPPTPPAVVFQPGQDVIDVERYIYLY